MAATTAGTEPKKRGAKGSIYPYETAEGTRYRFSFRDAAGKQSNRRGFTSPTAARRERERLMGNVHSGKLRVSSVTLADYWELYLPRRKPYLEDGTWQDYRRHGELRILPELGEKRLTALTSPVLGDWLIELSESGVWAPKTLNNALTALTVCLSHALDEGLVPANTALRVPKLPTGHIERDYLRLTEIGAYLDGSAECYRLLAETLVGTGARISEALALTVADVDLVRGAIIVYRSRKDDGKTGSTKGDRFRRVEIGPKLVNHLRPHIEDRLQQSQRDAGETLLFVAPVRVSKQDKGRWETKPAHEAIDRTTVSRGWHKEALEDAGLRDMPLHALRHTAAAAWLSTGHPLMFVQRQLGHAHITTTERLYGHLEEIFVRRMAAETEAAIEAAGGLYAEV